MYYGIFFSRCLLLPISAMLLANDASALSQSTQYAPVEVRTDLARKAAGVGVLMEWGTEIASFTTDLSGRTPSAIVDAGVPIVVTIGEARTPLGSTVGQVVISDDSIANSTDGDTRGLCQFVPEARTVHFEAIDDDQSSEYISQDRFTLDWYAHPFSASKSYDFFAGVAPLRYSDSIEAYFAYHQSVPPNNYVHGLLIRSGEVDLTANGMAIAIGKRDNQYANPSVDVVHMTDSTSGAAVSTVLGIDEEYVYVTLEGVLPAGDTLLLIRAGGVPGTTTSSPYQPVPVPPAGGGSGGVLWLPASQDDGGPEEVSAAGAVSGQLFVMGPNPVLPSSIAGFVGFSEGGFTPCEPEEPDDETYCPHKNEIAIPQEDSYDCGYEPIDLVGDGSKSDITSSTASPPPCNDSGVGTSKQVCWTWAGELEFEWEIKSVKVKGSLGFSHRACETLSLDSCTCVFTWQCDWENTNSYRICRDYLTWYEGWFAFREFWVRVTLVHSGSDAIQQITTCDVVTGNCTPSTDG